MCLWIWSKTFICNIAKTFICACYIILCADLWCMVQAYEILLCVEHKYCYALHKLRRVTSPFQCKGDHMQVLFKSIQPNRKWDGSDPISVLQPNRRRMEPILTTKQIQSWSRPKNMGWSHSNHWSHNQTDGYILDGEWWLRSFSAESVPVYVTAILFLKQTCCCSFFFLFLKCTPDFVCPCPSWFVVSRNQAVWRL